MVELGCGPGNLSIAAVLLGAEHVVSVDIDEDAIQLLKENLQRLKIDNNITTICADIRENFFIEKIKLIREERVNTGKIVVFSNPPFGVHSKGLDLIFLKQAFQFADIIYSIHNSSPKSEQFLIRKIGDLGGIIAGRAKLDMILKHTYTFHQKQQKRITTDVFKIIVKKK
jgi:putative methylase